MLIRAATSTLLVVDIQERLLPAIDDGPALVEYSQWLLRVARALDVPVLASEQYSKGLGPTVAALRDELDATQILEKLDFSAAAVFASARIMWQEFGIAFCLVLVLEGILPFLCPRQWREAVTGIGRLSDRHLRLVGLGSMLLGTLLLYWIH